MASLYESVLRDVQSLTCVEKLRLIAHVRAQLHDQNSAESPQAGLSTSILELQGLGKEIWQEQDAQDYVDRERSSWNG